MARHFVVSDPVPHLFISIYGSFTHMHANTSLVTDNQPKESISTRVWDRAGIEISGHIFIGIGKATVCQLSGYSMSTVLIEQRLCFAPLIFQYLYDTEYIVIYGYWGYQYLKRRFRSHISHLLDNWSLSPPYMTLYDK